jgi:hypothetical protein
MSIIPQLAISLGRRDEEPNIVLAETIASANNKAAVEELVANLKNKDKKIVSDCIKVFYEIAARRPELIAPHFDALFALLDSKDNRLVWGAMTALDSIAAAVPDKIAKQLNKILTVTEAGSVITKDHAVGILVALAANKKHEQLAMQHLLDQLANAVNNQFGMYSEQIATVLPDKYKQAFIEILNGRIPLLEKDSQKKRIDKLLKNLK